MKARALPAATHAGRHTITMQPRRYYPSWLPPNPRERAALTRLKRRQNLVIIWLIGLLPAGVIAAIATGSSDLLVPLTLFWIVAGMVLAQRVSAIPCPRCGEQFSGREQLPYWSGLLNRRCDSCGLTLKSDRGM
ncbi:MAG TPA: hypothetical protein VKS22_00335 [Candidatus Binataceae bacterium]|nr:hypothetical protein [Candidatus Binataceae bacterium]